MYRTIPETAEYLGWPIRQVEKYISEGRIRAVHDGEQLLVNQDQFNLYFEQIELLKDQIDEWKSKPLPPDRDINDED